MQLSAAEKQCTRCRRSRPLSDFPNDKRLRSGLGARCKECKSGVHKEWRDKNREHVNESGRRRSSLNRDKVREANRRCHEKHKSERNVKARAWLAENRDKAREYTRAWRKRNPEHANALERKRNKEAPESARARHKRYRERHPDRVRAIWNQHRARRIQKIRNSRGVTTREWEEILVTFGHCCAYCLQRFDLLTMDHVIPLAHPDGWHEAGNVIPACAPCNSRKNDRPIWAMLRP